MHHLLGPEVPIEQSFFRVPRFAACIVGFWPQMLNKSQSWLTILLLCLGTFAVGIGGINEILYGFVHLHEDVSDALEAFCPGATNLPNMFVNFPYYPATYLLLVLSGEAAVLTCTAVDGFYACSCLYLCALFRMLQHDIRDAFTELQEQVEMQFSLAQNIQLQQRLVVLIERHNTLIDPCSDFTSEFSLIILMHFLSGALVLCMSILNMLLNSASIGILTYISYSVAALTQLYLYCSGGTYVSESSLDIATVIYDLDWYKCDVPTRRILLMMLQRAQKAIEIKVPFFAPSLPALRSIISTAGSYFALLRSLI